MKGVLSVSSQFVILASDVPRLSARDRGKNIKYISHRGSPADLAAVVVENAHHGLKSVFVTVMSFWHDACDALLSDADTMATLKVPCHPCHCPAIHPIPMHLPQACFTLRCVSLRAGRTV